VQDKDVQIRECSDKRVFRECSDKGVFKERVFRYRMFI